jgi:hypothetical protein
LSYRLRTRLFLGLFRLKAPLEVRQAKARSGSGGLAQWDHGFRQS